MDPIDTLTLLRSRQQRGEKWTGIDVMKGEIANMKSSDIIEPLAVGWFRFDVSVPGNSNAGHEYGADLADDERRELIEYLKTL